jgi:hypothetical protein
MRSHSPVFHIPPPFDAWLAFDYEGVKGVLSERALFNPEHPDQLERLKDDPALLSSAIEEVLRFRSPLQWVMRKPVQDAELHGQVMLAGNWFCP